MRIELREADGSRLRLPLPNVLWANGLTARLAPRILEKYAPGASSLTAGQLQLLFSAIKESRRILGGAPLVSVSQTNGECVTIYL